MIARRRLVDRIRKIGRRPVFAGAPEESVPSADLSVGRAEMEEDASLAADAFSRLRPEQQQVLELSIFHGRSHEEIANATGLPLGTVKTHARRGLIRIRELLEMGRKSEART